MRTMLALLAAVITLQGQPLPTGFVRGTLVPNQATALQGEFSVQSAPGTIYRFRSDSKTWMEREHERIFASGLRVGELLEVVTDRDPAELIHLHYARMVQVIEPARRRPVFSDGYHKSHDLYRNTTGENRNFIYAGVVRQLSANFLVLHTRFDGEKIIFLGRDTRCLEEGLEVGAAALRANTRVFVRGDKGENNELEAHQVVWGQILEPAELRD